MAKQRKKREKLTVPSSQYRDAEGNVLTLRGLLKPGARREYAEILAGGLNREDAWQRATELLFERLAVSWMIQGVRTDRQKELLAQLPLGRHRCVASGPGQHRGRPEGQTCEEYSEFETTGWAHSDPPSQ